MRLQGLQQIVPFGDEPLVGRQVGGVDPVFDLHLGQILIGALLGLQYVMEGIVFIVAGQREQPADARSYGVHAAAAFFVQEGAALLFTVVSQVGQSWGSGKLVDGV